MLRNSRGLGTRMAGGRGGGRRTGPGEKGLGVMEAWVV